MADPVNTTPVALSPATYERHAAAVEFVEDQIRTRSPLWGTGRFPGIIPGRWALLETPNEIPPSAGATLGVGTVKFCDVNGVVDPDAVETTVYNAGALISAGLSNKILRLTWTSGVWAVSCPGDGA